MNRKVLSVFLFSAWYPTEFDSLIGNFVQNHSRAISRLVKVIVIHPYEDLAGIQNQPFLLREEIDGNLIEVRIRCKKIKFKTIVGKLARFIRMQKAYNKGITHAIEKYGLPDISHVNILTRTAIPAIKLKWQYNIPYIITEHWSRYLPESNTYKGVVRKIATRYAVRKADAVTVVSSILKKAMINHHLNNPHYYIVPNAVDDMLFHPLPDLKEKEKEKEKKNILHISSLEDKVKNISGILRTVARLSKVRNDFTLTIIGNKKYIPEAKKLAKELQILDKFVFFKDEAPNEKLPLYYNYSDFHLLFSNYETQGLVLIESFACGKPVVATRTSGILEVVNKDNGILVDPKNEDKLLSALAHMLSFHNEYSSIGIRNYAIDNFGMDHVGNLFLSIYRKILFDE
jgi:glycosyltransferase involved in cell wall biosynthesis